MIKYALVCEQSHDFESWFQNSDAFDVQAKRGLISCPQCQSIRVQKAIMAPAIGNSYELSETPASASHVHLPQTIEETKGAEIRAMLRQLRDKITEGAKDVGADFAKEARKIHDGDAPEAAIIGQATPQEAHDLIADGIVIIPLPVFPDERN